MYQRVSFWLVRSSLLGNIINIYDRCDSLCLAALAAFAAAFLV
jgi:hypothetical protein